MAFSPVPTESKNQINKAGQILVSENPLRDQLAWAQELATKWRACHAYPINTFQATLRVKLREFKGDPIVAQRLKRMPTIVDKLRRHPMMKLTTMQDIGGLRAVMSTVPQVYKLAKYYRKDAKFAHELIDQRDYIKDPRDEDGYRSVHLIYRYANKLNPEYDGLRIELQIRSRLQHTWATAVETMGTFLGQALKSRQGDQEWLDFFAITSSAFAYLEKRPPVPRFNHLSREQTFKAVAMAETGLRALEKMEAFSIAADQIVKTKGTGKSRFYHLIVLDSVNKTVRINAYDRDSFAEAIADYSLVEAQVAQGDTVEPVLVSAGSISNLRRAYPNFFLDIGEFTSILNRILASATNPGSNLI